MEGEQPGEDAGIASLLTKDTQHDPATLKKILDRLRQVSDNESAIAIESIADRSRDGTYSQC